MQLIYPPEIVAFIERGSKSLADAVEEYERKLFRTFDGVKNHLVEFDLTSILDIGCGLGGQDILLAKHCGVQTIHLQDGVGAGEKLNKFSNFNTVPWNDVNLGRIFVEANTSAEVHAHTEVKDIRVNAILSFRAWGHHFPVDPYLHLVEECLVPGGIVMTDIRAGTDGARKLESIGLTRLKLVPPHSVKCDRIIFRK